MFIFKKNQTTGNLDFFKKQLLDGNVFGVKHSLIPEFVDKIIDDDDGKRAIHLSCKQGFFEIAKLLIKNHCNLEIETERKYRPIHWACLEGHLEILKLLIENQCDIESETRWKERPIHLSCEKGFLDISSLLVENQCNFESETAGSYRPLHLACENGHLSIVKLLVKRGCQVESETSWKERPIHLASINGHLDIVKYLSKKKCEIKSENIDGKTPLDLARQYGHKDIVKFLNKLYASKKIFECVRNNDSATFAELYHSGIFNAKEYETGLSVLEAALESSSDKIIKYILDKSVNDTEISFLLNANKDDKNASMIQLLKECVLFQSIRDHHQEGFQSTCLPDVINGPCNLIPSSFLETAVENGSWSFMEEILKKSVYKESQWDKAKESALKNGNHKMVEAISNRECLLKSRQKSNFTILHTAVCENNPVMVKHILDNKLVDPNSNHEVFGTPLALAYALCHKECVEALEKHNVDVNTQNKYLQTPLHEAISSGMDEDCAYLMDKTNDVDTTGYMGFTALHCSVMRGCFDLCDVLVKSGADCGRYVKIRTDQLDNTTEDSFMKTICQLSTLENAFTLCMKIHNDILPCLEKCLTEKTANSIDGYGSSLIDIAIKGLQPEILEKLLQAGGKVNDANQSGKTPLLELLSIQKDEILPENLDKIKSMVNILVEHGAHINVTSANEESVFTCASKFMNESLMILLLKNRPQIISFTEEDFKLTFSNHWFHFAQDIIPLLSKDFLSVHITSDIMDLCINNAYPTLIMTLFCEAKSTVKQLFVEELLCKSVSIDDKDMFKSLVNWEMCVAKVMENENNKFTNLLCDPNNEFYLRLLESKSNSSFLNLRKEEIKSSWKCVIDIENIDTIEDFFLEIDNDQLNCEDIDGNTPLTLLFQKMSTIDEESAQKLTKVAKSLICRGSDIYAKTTRGAMVIDECPLENLKDDLKDYFDRKRKRSKK